MVVLVVYYVDCINYIRRRRTRNHEPAEIRPRPSEGARNWYR